jgi:hypothetical protein
MEGREKPQTDKYNVITNDYNYDDCCILTSLPVSYLQGNDPVCQVETSPKVLLVYRVHLVMIAHNI